MVWHKKILSGMQITLHAAVMPHCGQLTLMEERNRSFKV